MKHVTKLIASAALLAASALAAQAEEFRDRYTAVREMIGRIIVGHEDIVHGVLTAMLCGGHCLLSGVSAAVRPNLTRRSDAL